MKYLYFILLGHISINIYSQIIIKGKVTDSSNFDLPGVIIKEENTKNKTTTDLYGLFEISVKNDSSILDFSSIGYLTKKINVNEVSKDTTHIILFENNSNLEDIIIIAPDPPSIEIGYFGLIPSRPIGLRLNLSKTWGYNFYGNFEYASNLKGKNYYYFSVAPYYSFKYKILNSYFDGYINRDDTITYVSLFLCKSIKLIDNLVLNLGVGPSYLNNSNPKVAYFTGLTKYIACLPLKFFKTYFAIDFLYNQKYIDWYSYLYVELYDREYKKLTFSIGYKSLFKTNDLMLNINYKYYFYDRKPYRKS
jgi:hypothetical protein